MFDSQTRLLLNILEILYREKKYVTVASLSNNINLERKAISTYCTNLEANYEEIILKKGWGYKFIGGLTEYQKVRLDIIKNCQTVIILKTIFFKKNITILKLSDENFISMASTRRNIHIINVYLKQFKVQIKTKKGQAFFSGKEENIRYCAYILFWKYLKYEKWPFYTIEHNKVRYELSNLLGNSELIIDNVTQKRWMYIFSINLIRYSQGYLIEDCFFSTSNYQIFNLVRPYFKISKYVLPQKEILFMSVLAQMTPLFYLSTNFGNKVLNLHKSIQTNYFYVIENLIDNLSISIPSEKLTKFRVIILSTLIRSEIFSYVGFSLTGYQTLKYFSLKFTGLSKKIDAVISANPSIYSNYDDQLLRAGMNEALLFIHSPSSYENIIIIELETDLSFGEEELLRRTLETILSLKANIRIVHQSEHLDEQNPYKITTLPYHKKSNVSRELVIHPSLGQKDIINLLNFVDGILNNRNLKTK